MPVSEIGRIASENGILFLLDASQGIGSLPVNVNNIRASMVAFPGHKGLLGPQGTGGLYTAAAANVKLKPIMSGGTGSLSEYLYQPDILPDKFESGTVNTPGIVGLGAGAAFIEKTGLETIRRKKEELTKRLIDGLSENKLIKMYNSENIIENSGIVAFNIKGIDSSEISYLLDEKYNIACRAGLHCAPLAHKHFGTQSTGIVRLSVGYFNSISEIDKTVQTLNNIVRMISK
jgi:selenocysteine lyase/cysteine desulfurase